MKPRYEYLKEKLRARVRVGFKLKKNKKSSFFRCIILKSPGFLLPFIVHLNIKTINPVVFYLITNNDIIIETKAQQIPRRNIYNH